VQSAHIPEPSLNTARKYVASSNPAARLDWPNSTLLHGDAPAAVADLKKSPGTNLVIMGSGVLIGSLMAAEGIVFQRIEYQFSAGALDRTVTVLSSGKVVGDSMSGTFVGSVAGTFFRSGSFTATRVPAKGP
jgi:hypothetical protein